MVNIQGKLVLFDQIRLSSGICSRAEWSGFRATQDHEFFAISKREIGTKIQSPKGRLIKGSAEDMPFRQMKIEGAVAIEKKNAIDRLIGRGRAGVWIRRVSPNAFCGFR